MTELLSVVMPTHNRPNELLRAAKSVLDQDVAALELVVVDDASDDDQSSAALDRLAADSRVVVVHTEKGPVGPCHARNRGLAQASGELVSFCDDDDMWLPEAGPAVVGYLAAHPHFAMASSWHVVSHVGSGARVLYRSPTDYDAHRLLWQNLVAMPFGVVRRSVLDFDVSFDPAQPTGEDWDLWLRCAMVGPVGSVAKACYVYSQHGGQRVTAGMTKQIEGRRNFVSKHGTSMSGACRLYHETILAGYEEGRRAQARHLRRAGARSAGDAALAAMVLAASRASSRWGVRRGDPGLQARIMASMVARLDRGARAAG